MTKTKMKEKLHGVAATLRRTLDDLRARVRSLRARVGKGATRAA